nr:myosin heavy chain, muscle-like [Penaeus vannamei]
MKDQAKPYDPKKSYWCPDPDEGFVECELQGPKGDKLVTVKVPSGEMKDFKKEQVGQVNPPKYEKCEDVSNLTFLNDPSVFYVLKSRYQAKLIYTYSGLFCIAVNPYKRYPSTPTVPSRSTWARGTENTKKVLSYFANVGASEKKEGENKQNLEDQIIQTNPILEAYGNAKTTRNDNSSRFGKFIRVHFAPNGKLSGADIEVYLLEKARVISQSPAERGYHIFYQLMCDQIDYMKKMCLLSDDIYDYHYEAQGKVTVPSIDDKEDMQFTHEAFDI